MTTASGAPRLAIGDYGPVRVVAGPHTGKCGYYDDDDPGDHGTPGAAIVYFGQPFDSDYVRLPYECLVPSDVPHLPTETWRREHPEAARQLGVEASR